MRPYDKQGRPLYGETWDRVDHYGTQLEMVGYQEHRAKANLFVRAYQSVHFYADLRGTALIPLWRDSRPLFYWHFRRPTDDLTARRMIVIEATRLAPIPIRLTLAPDAESLRMLEVRDHELFARPRPQRVPPARVPGAPVPMELRDRLPEAVVRSTGELVHVSMSGTGDDLICPACRETVRRCWNGVNHYFQHAGRSCRR